MYDIGAICYIGEEMSILSVNDDSIIEWLFTIKINLHANNDKNLRNSFAINYVIASAAYPFTKLNECHDPNIISDMYKEKYYDQLLAGSLN